MKRKVVLHIGLPKTGSTAIQTFLSRNQSSLLESSIDYLPISQFEEGRKGVIASGNGAHLARAMLNSKDEAFLPWDDARAQAAFLAAAERSDAETLLLSSELFALATPEGWSRLLATVDQADLDLSIVAVVRNHCDFLSSSYIQAVKRHRIVQPPPAFIRDFIQHNQYLRYGAFFRDLKARLGTQISLLSFDAAFVHGGLIQDFLSALGPLGENTPKEIARINISPTPEEVAFLRVCNRYGPRMNFSDVLARVAPGGEPRSPAWTVVGPQLAEEISSMFAEDTHALQNEFSLGPDFFAQPCANYIDIDALVADPAMSIRMMARYLVAFDHAIHRPIQKSA
jgi:hypothetical protein